MEMETELDQLAQAAFQELQAHSQTLKSFSLDMSLIRAFNLIIALHHDPAAAGHEKQILVDYFSKFPACLQFLKIAGVVA